MLTYAAKGVRYWLSRVRNDEPNRQSPQPHPDTSPKSEPALELHSRAAPSVEAHYMSMVLRQEEIPEKNRYKLTLKTYLYKNDPEWYGVSFLRIGHSCPLDHSLLTAIHRIQKLICPIHWSNINLLNYVWRKINANQVLRVVGLPRIRCFRSLDHCLITKEIKL